MTSGLSRILVALAGLPVVLGIVWLGGWWLFALAAAAAGVALHELFQVTRSLGPLVLAGFVGSFLALLGAELGGPPWMVGGFLITLLLAFVLKGFARAHASVTVAVGTTVLAVAWIGLGLSHMLLIRHIPEHAQLVSFTVLLAVFAGDTIAYFTGRLFGRHKLAPATSPGKTWEGWVGGTLATILVVFFALYQTRNTFVSVWQALVLGAVIAVVAPLGDLFASAVKRDAGVKDFSGLLAGHGGMLDRIDALLFAAVASYYTLLAFGVVT
jgi:phosphatidate cytidylyltransferase